MFDTNDNNDVLPLKTVTFTLFTSLTSLVLDGVGSINSTSAFKLVIWVPFLTFELSVKKKLLTKKKKVKPVKAQKKKNLRQFTKNFSSYFKLPEKRVKKVRKVEEVKVLKEIKPVEVKKVEKREIPAIDRRAELEKRRKEQLLVKIRREQEKQRRKFREISY